MQQFTWYYKTHNKNTYSVTALGTTAIDYDQWHYIVGTSDNGIWKIYVDGLLEDTYNGDPGTFSNLDEPFYIGGFTGNYLDGCIKEVSLWNSVKTAVEIDIEFENYLGYSGSETNLKGYWKVDEGTLTNLNDLSSGNNDLTTQNSPTWVSESLVVAYSPDVIQWSDYYPFGSQLNGRHGGVDDYRYGFQGQECDDEIKGEGNSINYTYRMHDPRVGRFFTTDPLEAKYSFYSPYIFSGNRLIDMVELEGQEPTIPGIYVFLTRNSMIFKVLDADLMIYKPLISSQEINNLPPINTTTISRNYTDDFRSTSSQIGDAYGEAETGQHSPNYVEQLVVVEETNTIEVAENGDMILTYNVTKTVYNIVLSSVISTERTETQFQVVVPVDKKGFYDLSNAVKEYTTNTYTQSSVVSPPPNVQEELDKAFKHNTEELKAVMEALLQSAIDKARLTPENMEPSRF